MMFGFGDEADPLTETAELMEDLVVEYVQYMVSSSTNNNTNSSNNGHC